MHSTVQECRNVPREKCYSVPYEDCETVEHEYCFDKPQVKRWPIYKRIMISEEDKYPEGTMTEKNPLAVNFPRK